MDLVDDLDLIIDNYDEELMNARRPYNSSNRYNHWDNLNRWDELEFYQRFRLTKQSVLEVLPLIEQSLYYESNRNNPLPPLQQLLLTLRFFATGGFYVSVGDFGAIHKSTVCKIVHKVTEALAVLRPTFIKMPQTDDEKFLIQKKFMDIARFPRVIGAIDCTHIKIESPGGPNAEVFRNRKGYFSLNVQAICNANYKFLDIVARWPGSAHDSNIFDNSIIKNRFVAKEFGNAVLLGDSGYALREFMMTPIQNPRDEAESLFNESHIRTRGVIERTFGIWKRRFPCLSMGLRCRIPLVQNIIVASAILHNIARDDANESLETFGDNHEEEQDVVLNTDHGHFYRADFLNYFRNLR